jgi:hypothetical protein
MPAEAVPAEEVVVALHMLRDTQQERHKEKMTP